jgi:hypothetical protein
MQAEVGLIERVVNATQRATSIVEKRTVEGTKRGYKQKISQLTSWVRQNHPTHINNHKIVIPLPADIMNEFFGFICINERNEFKHFSTVSGYRSAIADYYKENGGKVMKDRFSDEISSFIKGYKRQVAELKQNGEMSITEGKIPLPFSGYQFLATRAVFAISDFQLNMFAWLFMLLSWNLMARSISVATIMYNHIAWANDALVITLPRHKGDQEGSNSYPKHVYANPSRPEVSSYDFNLLILTLCADMSCVGFGSILSLQWL